MLTGIKTVAARELHRVTTRPLYLLATIILPMLSFAVFWIIFHTGVPQNLPVSVCDADQSQTSRRITRMLDSSALLKVTRHATRIEEGKRQMLKRETHALIVLPKDLEKDLLKGQPPGIVNFYNNEFLLIGSLIGREVRTVVSTVSKGLNVAMRQKKSEMTEAAMAHMEPVVLEKHVLFNPYLNYFYYLTGTLQPAMLQIFIITMTIFAIGVELKEGTARQLFEKGNFSTLAVMMGKLLPYSLVYILLGLFMNVYLFRIPGFPFRGSLWVLFTATILLVLAYQAMGVLIISTAANLRMSLSLTGFYSATAFAFVGVTFPDMGMVPAAKLWSRLLPLTYYIRIFVDQSMKGAPVSVSLKDLCSLSFFVLVPMLFSISRMRTILTDDRYWGRS